MLRPIAPDIDDTENLDRLLGDLMDDDVELVDDDLTCSWLTTLVSGKRMSSHQVTGLARSKARRSTRAFTSSASTISVREGVAMLVI